MWGVFELADEIHIIPVDNNGIMLPLHSLDSFCDCYPETIEQGEDGRIIINHNEVN